MLFICYEPGGLKPRTISFSNHFSAPDCKAFIDHRTCCSPSPFGSDVGFTPKWQLFMGCKNPIPNGSSWKIAAVDSHRIYLILNAHYLSLYIYTYDIYIYHSIHIDIYIYNIHLKVYHIKKEFWQMLDHSVKVHPAGCEILQQLMVCPFESHLPCFIVTNSYQVVQDFVYPQYVYVFNP